MSASTTSTIAIYRLFHFKKAYLLLSNFVCPFCKFYRRHKKLIIVETFPDNIAVPKTDFPILRAGCHDIINFNIHPKLPRIMVKKRGKLDKVHSNDRTSPNIIIGLVYQLLYLHFFMFLNTVSPKVNPRKY